MAKGSYLCRCYRQRVLIVEDACDAPKQHTARPRAAFRERPLCARGEYDTAKRGARTRPCDAEALLLEGVLVCVVVQGVCGREIEVAQIAEIGQHGGKRRQNSL